MPRSRGIHVLVLLLSAVVPAFARGDEADPFALLAGEYRDEVRPLLERFCLDCHASEEPEGELDLERFAAFSDVRRDPSVWQKVVEMLGNGEMPPKQRRQPTNDERARLRGWARRYLDTEARANDGDPGRVPLRRLSNAEYTYTVRDLTGVELDPAREFPVDGAAGEGFTNTGDALVMSPALVTKYLDAARSIARHAVLLPDGVRFSPGTTPRDWTDEILAEIRSIYRRETDGEGRVDLGPYVAALIEHRDRLLAEPNVAGPVAAEAGLNTRYFESLSRMLVTGEPSSLLLDRVRALWRDATPADAPVIAGEIRAWQDCLWKYNPVGHFGSIRPWQDPVAFVATSEELRHAIEPSGSPGDDVVLHLVASTPETASSESSESFVVWERPRFERPGRPPLLLADLRATAELLSALRDESLAATARYLAAVREVIESPGGTTQAEVDLTALAARHDLRPPLLAAWLAYLGLASDERVTIDEYLHGKVETAGGYDFVKGWVLPGVADLSLVANASDTAVNIPGRANPHSVVVHPRPERWIAAGWQSPCAGTVRIAPRVADMHDQCGNGVSWSLERWRGARRGVLARGDVDLGGASDVAALAEVEVRRGDLVALIVGARDRNHVCDLTQIDLTITETAAESREWSLARDCADDILAGNPHADRFGNDAVWHFFTGPVDDDAKPRVIPAGSLLDRWLEAADERAATRLAREIEVLLTQRLPPAVSAPDRALYEQLTSLGGPLFARVMLDEAELAETPDRVKDPHDGVSRYGLDPARFGRRPDGAPAAAGDLVVRAPETVAIRAPRGLLEGAELVVTGRLDARSEEDTVVQLAVRREKPADPQALVAGVPLIVRQGTSGERRARRAIEEFNALFPRAFCYRQIVPVDEVVTLVLFHREDEHLARLLLDEAEAARLDRLWEELHYVSQDALTSVTVYEQLWQFATQDADPTVFEPLEESIRERAAAFRRQLVATEPRHLEALLDIATLAYRRPLDDREKHGLLAFHHGLRARETPHDEAFRLALARILTAPAFLYRLEKPPAGAAPGPVSDQELATRLSYFLWSSLPDEELRAAAAAERLRDPDVLAGEALRMLGDPRVRRLAIEFACQWLHIRGFDELDEKSERHFPTFEALRDDIYEEAVLFFTDLFRTDGSVLGILGADHTFLNEALAEHYGIPGVSGAEWRRVDGVREHSRGGVLALAATLARHSGASRTSPILRGNWVAETLLGEKLPRPPKDVPQLPETTPQGLSERQLIEMHASEPACAKCHARIDPYGFALEAFDTIGRARKLDAAGLPVDTRAVLPDGTRLEGVGGLRAYLLEKRRDAFVRQFTRKLLGYALGRAVELSDEPLLERIDENLAGKSWRVSAVVDTIVRSRQFREIRGADAGDAGAEGAVE